MKTHLQIPSRLDALSDLMDTFHVFCKNCTLEIQVSLEMQLVLEELVVNIIHHGTAGQEESTIDIFLTVNDHIFTMKIMDRENAFNPLPHKPQKLEIPFEERDIGGMGILLVRELMDSMSYQYSNGKNIVLLTKQLPKD